MQKFLSCIILIIISIFLLTSPTYAIYINTYDTYCTVKYQSDKKLKVGIKYENKTIFYDYKSNKKLQYAFEHGNGEYTILLYEQVKNNSYKVIEQQCITVDISNELAPYLISTYDIQFSTKGIIAKTSAKICKDCKDTWSKVLTIKTYVDERIKYDYAFADSVTKKEIVNYIPNPLNIWRTKKGICYDIASLFAAMCRSQGIPCKIQKGYVNEVYHAWNEVYVDGEWYSIDVKQPVSK